MKKLSKTLLLAATIAVTAPMANATPINQDVVRDTEGKVILNSWNNCVHTKWLSNNHGCGKTIIAREERTVFFAFASSSLTPVAESKLDNLISTLGINKDVKNVSIVGFADTIGSKEANYALSRRRANSVTRYLQARGVNTKNISVRAFGEDSPVSNCDDVEGQELKACLWQDRRVEIVLNYNK